MAQTIVLRLFLIEPYIWSGIFQAEVNMICWNYVLSMSYGVPK
jgi:hypothetical protein